MRDIQRNRTRNDLRFFLVRICAPKCRNDPIHARRPRLCGRDHRLRVCRRALYRCDWGWYWVHVRLAAYSPRVHPWRYGYPARSRCQGRRFGRLGVISSAISRGVRKMPPLCDTVYISSRLNVATFACSPGLCKSPYHTIPLPLPSFPIILVILSGMCLYVHVFVAEHSNSAYWTTWSCVRSAPNYVVCVNSFNSAGGLMSRRGNAAYKSVGLTREVYLPPATHKLQPSCLEIVSTL